MCTTSRRENFFRRISGNPGNFPPVKFPQENFGKYRKLPPGKISHGGLFNIMLCFSIKVLPKRVLCTRSISRMHKVSPRGNHLCFHKTGGNFFWGKVSPEISRENVATDFPGKIFLQKFLLKVLRHKLCKSLISRLQSITQVWFVSNVGVKIWGENFPSGEFREIQETSRRENFPPGISPGIFGHFPETAL